MVVTARRSLPALYRLEREYRSKIYNKYSDAIRICSSAVEDVKAKRTKQIMEDLEGICLAKYDDELVKILRCESKHSRNDESYVELGFKYEPKVEPKDLKFYKEQKKKLEEDQARDLLEVDRWQLAQLAAMKPAPSIDFSVVLARKK